MAEENKTNYLAGAGKVAAYVFVSAVSSQSLYKLIEALPWVQQMEVELRVALLGLVNVVLWTIVKYIDSKGWVDTVVEKAREVWETRFPGVDPESDKDV